jgi:hypothetical protein
MERTQLLVGGDSKLIRIGVKQKAKLEAMAMSNRCTIRDFTDLLVELAHANKDVSRSLGELIDREFQRRIEEHPTLAEVEAVGAA